MEALEQELFDNKTQLEYEKQNAKDTTMMEEKLMQLQSENSELVAHLNRIQRERTECYEQQESPISFIKKKLSYKHNYRVSGCSNYSDEEEIKTFINQLQFPAGGQFWEGDEIS